MDRSIRTQGVGAILKNIHITFCIKDLILNIQIDMT